MALIDYQCESCGHEFTEMLMLAERDRPTQEPCPSCGKVGCVVRPIGAPAVSHRGVITPMQRAGTEWNDLLKKMKKGSGKGNQIRTR